MTKIPADSEGPGRRAIVPGDRDLAPSPSRGWGLSGNRIALGLAGFIVLGTLGAWAAASLDPTGSLTARGVLAAVPASTLMLAVALAFADFLLGGLRLHVWIRRVAPGTSWRASLESYLVNLFAASISPMGSASAPAQLATLARFGVPPAKSLAALMINFIGLMSAFLIVGGTSGLYLATSADLSGTSGNVLRALLVVISAVMVLMVVVVGNPRAAEALALRLVEAGRDKGWGRLRRLGTLLVDSVRDYREALETLRVGWHRPFAIATTLSAAMLLNKCLVGYVLARGFGFEGSYVDVAARQSLQWLLIYFSPSPGGSGVAEASVPAFLEGIVPQGHVLEFTVIWRVVTAMLGAGLGAVVAFRVLGLPRPLADRP